MTFIRAMPVSAARGEELLDAGIADGHAADGDVLAVDEDVAAEVRAVVALRLGEVGLARVVDEHGEVVAAARVQQSDPIEALGDLIVALAQLRAAAATRGEDGVVADEAPARFVVTRPHHEAPLALEDEQRDAPRRIGDVRAHEERPEPRARRAAVERDGAD
jgi:hypothetical protein